ncbi:acetyl-CoA carboxylase carboxyltransferase subunit alpha [Aquisalinus flavus]|uniref:Acetyl-coenzyme A carboxylase carboxyl transferase subunit alpha n=1 Tax=Aquisalinus flavus TaxID=1526572 RepID=A0A8J2Y3I0_9PROT|nr:acetyl-CoA carboxylase carboxyltransferase subunit alpha [Aquisalinus flavus]MBD0427924.1 acetyl-CoA carboxylase carboxyltransferase subunit alpha [Aquisalinus flavus]UNE47681.1 acetyl-CoA carboxylase carboxyltransferase subunit alpha [Aquisalinus flavus]GGD04982.1 acetyl-coenzyme A carboxylase carboxyl transferase subunit alpha [Aquisalinus flavus]
MRTYLDFEKPIAELESRIEDLRGMEKSADVNVNDEISRLEVKAQKLLSDTYSNLTRWQKTSVARHAQRPHFCDYIEGLTEDFTPLAGDRSFGEDEAIVGGPARFRGRSVMFIGHEKGRDTESRLKHNFGSARPEGYRKAIRLMEMAERFQMPVVTLVDTAGAYPGLGAEERGQAEAIATCTETCLALGSPLISVIVGEGGSGGAVAIAAGNRVMMLEHAIYSVISPEGCASILWRDAQAKGDNKAPDAAEAMKISAADLLELGVIDQIISEPLGGAHRDVKATIERLGDAVEHAIHDLEDLSPDELRKQRREKFLTIGRVGLA